LRSFYPFALAAALCTASVQADVKLPAIFGDHMVLQRDAHVPVWGWANPGEGVTVTAGSATAKTTAGADGKWVVKLDPMKAGDQPIDLVVSGKNTIKLTDVLIGEVWICAGQSNMGYPLNASSTGAQEVPKAKHPMLRLFMEEPKIAFEPQADCVGKWQLCTPGTAANFSAVGYFFGRDLEENLSMPVGMIESSLGGTAAEAWTSLEALQANPLTRPLADDFEANKPALMKLTETYENVTLPKGQQDIEQWRKEVNPSYQAALKSWNDAVKQAHADGTPVPPKPLPSRPRPSIPAPPNRHTPTTLYNGMIPPLIPFAIKGVIWYQGEADEDRPIQYRAIFPTMITDWRTRWGEGDFPFLFVQLPNAMARVDHPSESGWAGVREAQSMALALPNTADAVTIDGGEDNIHPPDKIDVEKRLFLATRKLVYGEDIIASGPTFKSASLDNGKMRIAFDHVGSGLTIGVGPSTRPGVPPAPVASELKGFAIAGADKHFVWADAKIDGDSVLVWSNQVSEPVAVRYGWADNPEVNLYNKEGLPAAPFRTDDWPFPKGLK